MLSMAVVHEILLPEQLERGTTRLQFLITFSIQNGNLMFVNCFEYLISFLETL